MVSIIIVNYNLKDDLLSCISSVIETQQNIGYEIIVIDNSQNNNIEKKLRILYPKVKYHKSHENIGYGQGNNLGVEKAKGEFIFILNPDTKIIAGKIAFLIKFIKNNKKIGAVAPQLLNKNGKVYDEQGAQELTPFRAIFVLSFINKLFRRNRIYKNYWGIPWKKNRPKNVDVIPGTAFLIKKELFEKIGGFDRNFFLYFEEFDLCRRLIKQGYKNYIHPDLKISHKWGASTSKNEFSKKYFLESRFYYFRKNYGILKSVFTELFLRISKDSLILFGILIFGFCLRIYNLNYSMPFLGDTAWFFIAARDILLNGQLPLVGITSSHVWLHQGAYWSYLLAIIFKLFGFNPLNAAYFAILIDLATLFTLYLFCKSFLNKKIALISVLLYSASPFIVISSQIPYHTSPIPLLVILLLFSALKWISGKIYYFPLNIFLLALLYNFQISSVPLIFSFLVVIGFGIIKKKDWLIKLLNLKLFVLSLFAFLIPMLPMLLFDIKNGFPQTLKVVVWLIYKIAVFFGYPPVNPAFIDEPRIIFFNFVLLHIGRIYFVINNYFGLTLFIFFITIFIFEIIKIKYKNITLNIVFIFFSIPAMSFLAMNSRSQAYLPMFFPILIIIAAYSIVKIFNKNRYLGSLILLLVSLVNVWGIVNYPRGSESLSIRMEAAQKIIKEADGQPYNIIGKGPNSEFISFTNPFIYLTWWLGTPPSDSDQKLKFYISEASDTILFERKIVK